MRETARLNFSASFLSGWKEAEVSRLLLCGPLSPLLWEQVYSYLLHFLLSHAKLVVAKQKGPNILSNFMFHTTIVHLPQQFQLFIILRKPKNKDCVTSVITVGFWVTSSSGKVGPSQTAKSHENSALK